MKRTAVILSLFALLAISVLASFEKVDTYKDNFTDINDASWYAEDVKTAYELGFMNGKSEGSFDPDGNVTVAEAIAMASRLHSIYNDKEIQNNSENIPDVRYDFDDPSIFVDLTERNSRNDNGVALYRAKGSVKDGMLVFAADGLNSHNSYDPGFYIEGLDLYTGYYNKIKFRMKRNPLPNIKPNAPRKEVIEIFFETNSNVAITGDKCVTKTVDESVDMTEWFEMEIDLSGHKRYTDVLKSIRFDTTNNNGEYFIDYVVFTTGGEKASTKWYQMYLDYAVENGIVHKEKYILSDMEKPITRADLCLLFAAALPEEYYNPVNDIKGIPDVDRFDIRAGVLQRLYKAGVVLGSDKDGNFNPDSNIKRSETAAIINRAALAENRVKGDISCDWAKEGFPVDVEFNDDSCLERVTVDGENVKISDGVLDFTAVKNKRDRFDPKITVKNLDFDAHDYSKIIVRIRPDFAEGVVEPYCDLYFMNVGDNNFSEEKSVHIDYSDFTRVDIYGWYTAVIDLRLVPAWQGRINAIRFDPANSEGSYEVDYIRFIDSDGFYAYETHEELVNAGYSATRLLRDEGFERGFYVSRIKNTATSLEKGIFQDYCETDEKPLWNISPHWARFDLVDDRDTTTDKYTIADKHGASTVTYNPEEKSVSMRVNATKIYEGEPHIADEYEWWPHLLLSQDDSICPLDKERNSAAADRMFFEIDIRCTDFKDTINPDGINSPNFLIYFYMRTDKSPGDLIWFGLKIFNGLSARTGIGCSWSPDSAAHQYMYGIPASLIFDGIENSFNPEKGVVAVSDEWKHIRFDVTPHIERAVEWANRDNIFGTPVTVEDMYFEGANIGFETHGNYDYTFEVKNFNMVSYNK